MIVKWNAQKFQKVDKKLGEMTKVFQGLRYTKNGGHKHFFKKAPEKH